MARAYYPLTTNALPAAPPPLTPTEAAALLAEWGRNELEEKSTPKWLIFLKMVRGRRTRGTAWPSRHRDTPLRAPPARTACASLPPPTLG